MEKDQKHVPGVDPKPENGKDDQHGHKIHTGKPGTSHSMPSSLVKE